MSNQAELPLLSRALGFAGVFIAFALPVIFVIGGVRLVMFPWFMNFEYTRPGFPVDYYGFTAEDRLEYGPLGIEYILNGEPISFLAKQQLPASQCWNATGADRPCAMFNAAELKHMEDVKFVAQIAFAVGTILFVLCAAAIILCLRMNYRTILHQALFNAGVITLGSIALLLVTAGIAWDFFFDTFHALLFEDGTWRFLYSDTLIRLYPEQFWFDAAVTIGLFSAGAALISIGIAIRMRRGFKSLILAQTD